MLRSFWEKLCNKAASLKSDLCILVKRSLTSRSGLVGHTTELRNNSKIMPDLVKIKITSSLSSSEPSVILDFTPEEIHITAGSKLKAASANSFVLDAYDYFLDTGKPQAMKLLTKHQNFAVRAVRCGEAEDIAAEHFKEIFHMLMENHRLMVRADILLLPGFGFEFQLKRSIERGYLPTEEFFASGGGIRAPSGSLYRFETQ